MPVTYVLTYKIQVWVIACPKHVVWHTEHVVQNGCTKTVEQPSISHSCYLHEVRKNKSDTQRQTQFSSTAVFSFVFGFFNLFSWWWYNHGIVTYQ